MDVRNSESLGETVYEPIVVSEGKVMAIIAYITLIGLVIAFIMNNEKKNQFANYHIRQALGLALCGLVLGLINIIPVLGWFIAIVGYFILFVLWVMGLISALNGKAKPVYLLGEKFQEWFKDI